MLRTLCFIRQFELTYSIECLGLLTIFIWYYSTHLFGCFFTRCNCLRSYTSMHGLSTFIVMSYSKLLYFIYFFGYPVSLFRVISIIILIYFSRPLSHSLIIIYTYLKSSRNLHVYFIIILLFSHNL